MTTTTPYLNPRHCASCGLRYLPHGPCTCAQHTPHRQTVTVRCGRCHNPVDGVDVVYYIQRGQRGGRYEEPQAAAAVDITVEPWTCDICHHPATAAEVDAVADRFTLPEEEV